MPKRNVLPHIGKEAEINGCDKIPNEIKRNRKKE
jgi:hypothetical protein